MNALRNHVLHEIAQLDIQSLLALEPLLAALKKPSVHSLSAPKRGVAAARCPLPVARCPLPVARCPLPVAAKS